MVIDASKIDNEKNSQIDDVDKILAKEDGKIVRKEKTCRHSSIQKCTNYNITFENDIVCNRFLNYWRLSSFQRIGYLIGRYEVFTEVPLGIRAVVTAIYEPPQSSGEDFCKLEKDPHSELVDKLCHRLGMKRIGWIFTDLWSADLKAGTVHCLRHEDSFLLSASECITAGKLQSQYKNYTEFSYEGTFGSKFVTVVASGDKTQQINLCGYQVSNQCTAMVDADIICPVQHQPELAWVREKPLHEKHYITDVQYTEKDEYGAEVRRDGRPMPVEYLMVDVPAGLSKEPANSFVQNEFPVENRILIGQIQVSKYIGEKNSDKIFEWTSKNDIWSTFIELVNYHVPTAPPAEVDQKIQNQHEVVDLTTEGAAIWPCSHCTYENTEPRADCAICGLPLET